MLARADQGRREARPSSSPDTKANGLGAMNVDTWQKTISTLVDQGAMKQPTDAAKAFTDNIPDRSQAGEALNSGFTAL